MDSTEYENELISRNNLYLLRKQKVKKEIEAAKRLIKKDVDILEIADKFIHEVFELMKEGISMRNVKLSEEEIQKIVRNNVTFKEKIRSNRKRYINYGWNRKCFISFRNYFWSN